MLKLQNDRRSSSITAHVSPKKQATFDCPNHYSKIFSLAHRRDAGAAETLSTTVLRKCSPQRAIPSPLSDSPSLLMVVCMEDKEKKVGLVWMMSLRGLTWGMSWHVFVVLCCVVFLSHFFFLCSSSSIRSLMDSSASVLPQTKWTNLVFVWRQMRRAAIVHISLCGHYTGVHFSHSTVQILYASSLCHSLCTIATADDRTALISTGQSNVMRGIPPSVQLHWFRF